MSEPSNRVPQWDGVPCLEGFLTFSEAREKARLELLEHPTAENLRALQVFPWAYEMGELTGFRRPPGVRFRVRSALAVRRQLSARSTRPWRRRLPPVGSLVWPELNGYPDLISLYAGLR